MEAAVAPLPELSLIVRRRGPPACDARFMSLKMLQVSRAAPCHLPRGCLCSSEASAAAGNGNAQGHETLTDGEVVRLLQSYFDRVCPAAALALWLLGRCRV